MISYNRNSVQSPDWLVDKRNKKQNDSMLLQFHQDTKKRWKETGKKNTDWPSKIKDQWKDCRDKLIEIFHGKCAYCDTRRMGHGNVEHFRPKDLRKYWWLSLTWENLLFSCERCNQSHKRREFPLGPGSMRADEPLNNHHFENNIIINPLDEDPEALIAYRNDGDQENLVAEPSLTSPKRVRVTTHIELLKLNEDSQVNLARREIRNVFNICLSIYRNPKSSASDRKDSEIQLRYMASDDGECAGMIRYLLRKHGYPKLIA